MNYKKFKKRTQTTTTFGEELGIKESLYTAGGNVNSNKYYRKQYVGFFSNN
jgi:hypothetical protein